MKKILGLFFIPLIGALAGAAIYFSFFKEDTQAIKTVYLSSENSQPTFSRMMKDAPKKSGVLPDFVFASNASRAAVVHIESRLGEKGANLGYDMLPNFKDFFGEKDGEEYSPKGRASGSGVIISADGYIATNNHVIEDASKIKVTLLDNREFSAEVIGTDITTDLALLKIDVGDLPFLEFGNSDQVQIGEWVLAVGNPLNLASTVTAGIVSAKGRNLDLLSRDTDYAIESFIQTDAVVNRGNSGGALVNLQGELVGINTAISSQNGFYQGYSFAVPSTIARKVMEDLLLYGEVKRGLLGVSINPVSAKLARKNDLSILNGAYVERVNRNSGAYEAGIQKGDVIISVGDVPVSSPSELQEQISKFRPGDQVSVKAFRGDTPIQFEVRLKSLDESVGKTDLPVFEFKGNNFRELTPSERILLGLNNGGIIVEEVSGKMLKSGVKKGFAIFEINDQRIRSLKHFEYLIKEEDEYMSIKGLYDKGKILTYDINW